MWLWYCFLSESSSKGVIVRAYQRVKIDNKWWSRQSIRHTLIESLVCEGIWSQILQVIQKPEKRRFCPQRAYGQNRERRLAILNLLESNSSLKVSIVVYQMASITQHVLCSHTCVNHSCYRGPLRSKLNCLDSTPNPCPKSPYSMEVKEYQRSL